ncbi:MAG TPA: histidinol phosphate phosphatase, partial [Acidovorax sp.]|nr:histidinol phosphate phosphatase [Acidovorax sp.]
ERNEVRVVGSCEAHLQAGAALGGRLHLVCTGRSALLRPGGELPAGVPPGTQVHANLADFVDQLLPGALGAAAPLAAAPLPLPGHGVAAS